MDAYLAGSTIHGFNNLTSDKSFSCRIIWLGIILLTASYGGSIIVSSWRSWYESPVLTTMQPVSIKEIPLPGEVDNTGKTF